MWRHPAGEYISLRPYPGDRARVLHGLHFILTRFWRCSTRFPGFLKRIPALGLRVAWGVSRPPPWLLCSPPPSPSATLSPTVPLSLPPASSPRRLR